MANGADASPLFNLYNQLASAIPAAVNQLSGEVHAGVPALGFQAANPFLGTMLDPDGRGRLAGAAGGPGGTALLHRRPALEEENCRPATFEPARFSLWGATFGSRARTEGERVSLGIRLDSELSTNTRGLGGSARLLSASSLCCVFFRTTASSRASPGIHRRAPELYECDPLY